MNFVKLSLVSIGLSLASCAGIGTTPLPGKSLTSDYAVDGVSWEGGGVMIIAFDVFEKDGKVSVCGARSINKRKTLLGENLNHRALQAMSILIEDKTLVSNLLFFNEVPYPGERANSLKGEANCVLTGRPGKPEYGIVVRPTLGRGPRTITVQG